MNKGLKIISLFKVIRGLGALSISFSLFLASQTGVSNIREFLELHQDFELIDNLIPLLPEWLINISQFQVLLIAALVLMLSLIRLIEGVGIWFNKSWAEWLAIATGMITGFILILRIAIPIARA